MLSVIICTYNPAPAPLRRTLEALAKQTLPAGEWELLIVDNASPEPLTVSALADRTKRPFRLIFEPVPGLARARITGCREAKSDLLVYVDDDNLLAPDYLERALEISRSHPFLGAWSGHLEGEFETEPAPELRPYLVHLAIRDVIREEWASFPNYRTCPWGAGLCIRRRVVEAYARDFDKDFRSQIGTTGNSLARGEDTDLAFTACTLGLGLGVFPSLRLVHLMPAARLKKDYLLRIAEESTYANVVISHLHGLGLPPAPGALGEVRHRLRGLASGFSFEWRMQDAKRRGIARALKAISALSAAGK
ncbi:glycosyltransferase family 2 protein [Ruficoccus amylovorans]|uniref:Glycosyltransferase family 2 protein n=1 Tax=Ruficoccus amylovorans TaxID=1804625 RepID=A0A842H9C5_9BACT|nr:glycosyltransferase [Ruficoccus amylovorans]MBC2593022.1 glycosyltransferase family 2 protein [Ruficoccus amylovorans]